MEKTALIVLVMGMVLSVVHGQMCGNGCNQNQNCLGCGCGCSQNQNFYGGMMNNFGQPVSRACQGPLPCYNVVISQISDGPLGFGPVILNEQDFLRAPSRAGIMRSGVLVEGRKAATFFRDTYGVDFTSMPDAAFLTGKRVNEEGVELVPYVVDAAFRYRMYMASTKAGTQLFNRPIFDQGWVLNFTRPMWGRGTFRKLIPAGAFVVYGHYIIHPCGMPPMDDFPRPCSNILNPQDSWAPLVITYKSPTYITIVPEPYPHIPLDCMLEHPTWGEGRGRAIVTIRDEVIGDTRMTLTFPSFK